MTKFWAQDWFKDALPYAAAGLAVTGALAGYGASNGWFDSSGSGAAGADVLGKNATVNPNSGPIQGAGASIGDVMGTPGATLPNTTPASTTGVGNINSDMLKPDPTKVSGGIMDWMGRNPGAVLGLGSLGLGVAGNALSGTPKGQAPTNPTEAAAATARQRQVDLDRWNAIPTRPYQRRQQIRPVGARAGFEPEQAHYAGYAEGGGVLPEMERPNHIQGPGDGMSDGIDAEAISDDGSVRPIQVADGEYIIPSDVVSGLGNGSTSAGVRQLDMLLRRVRSMRQAPEGEQPGAIDPNQAMPA